MSCDLWTAGLLNLKRMLYWRKLVSEQFLSEVVFASAEDCSVTRLLVLVTTSLLLWTGGMRQLVYKVRRAS